MGVKDTCFRNIPDGCGLYMFQMTKSLMVLPCPWAQIGCRQYRQIGLHMAMALFGMTIVPSFLGHFGSEDPREFFWLLFTRDIIFHIFTFNLFLSFIWIESLAGSISLLRPMLIYFFSVNSLSFSKLISSP